MDFYEIKLKKLEKRECSHTSKNINMSKYNDKNHPHCMRNVRFSSLQSVDGDDNDSISSEEWEEDQDLIDDLGDIVEPNADQKKVLVTGGAGFIGSAVAIHLLNRGDSVIIVDEMNDYYDPKLKEANLKYLRSICPDESRLSIYKCDICDESFMQHVFEKERPKWVCHMAARAGVRPSIQDPYVYIHSNIRGTTHLMELSHKFGVENFVFASSSSVYGGSKSTFFSEKDAVDEPVSPYAASKKACELLAFTYHNLYQLNVTGLRFFTVFGPRP